MWNPRVSVSHFFLYGSKHTKQDFKISSEITVLTPPKFRKLDKLPECHSAASLIPGEKGTSKSLRYVITKYWRRTYVSFLWSHKSYAKLALLYAYQATLLATLTFIMHLANITVKTINCGMQSYMGCKHSLIVNLQKEKAASSVLIHWTEKTREKSENKRSQRHAEGILAHWF